MGRLSGGRHHQYLPERGGQWRYEQQRFQTWADFDGDGDMDLFLPASQEELTTAPCYSTPTACWAVRWGGGNGNHLRQPV